MGVLARAVDVSDRQANSSQSSPQSAPLSQRSAKSSQKSQAAFGCIKDVKHRNCSYLSVD
jgi:hypothetical protein